MGILGGSVCFLPPFALFGFFLLPAAVAFSFGFLSVVDPFCSTLSFSSIPAAFFAAASAFYEIIIYIIDIEIINFILQIYLGEFFYYWVWVSFVF